MRDALKQNQGGLEGIENIIAAPIARAAEEPGAKAAPPEDGIITAPEEIEAYAAIKAIVRDTIPASRVFIRDAKSYCAVLLDNKNYKPIARLHFNNRANKRLSIFSGPQDKKGEMFPIDNLDEIYQYASKIKAAVKAYDEAPAPEQTAEPSSGGE